MLSRSVSVFWQAPLLLWPSVDRRALADLLPQAPQRVLVLDRRFVRPLRALGHAVVIPESEANLGALRPPDGEPVQVICAAVPLGASDLVATLRSYAGWIATGGVIILRSSMSDRERGCAAFLHAELRDVKQLRRGRYLLTAGSLR